MNAHIPTSPLAAELRNFKGKFCNENQLIAAALRDLKRHLHPPILDVGAGLGDIARAAFPELPAILLDVEASDDPGTKTHKRVQADFFDYVRAASEVGTVLLVHVLQYLDAEPDLLAGALLGLRAKSLISVTNDNTGPFGGLMDWAVENIGGANPERPISFEGLGRYRLAERRPLTATLSYPDFESMASGFVSVLLDAPDTETSRRAMAARLAGTLPDPSIEIAQTVYCYVQD